MKEFERIGSQLGQLVQDKNEAYGDSFSRAEEILKILFPKEIRPEQYRDALAITRVIDKLFRLANKKEAFGENPWMDIAGYAILGIKNHEDKKSIIPLPE